MKTLIIGLGNPILSDDGVGVHVARQVAEKLASLGRTDVTVKEASVGGLRLMEMTEGFDRLILVDALTPADGKPGIIHRMTLVDLEQITPTLHSTSTHDTNLLTALEWGRQMGLQLPKEVIIFAVEVENVTEFGETLSPTVAQAIPELTALVLDEVS